MARFLCGRRAASGMAYATLMALAVVVILASTAQVGESVSEVMTDTSQAMDSAGGAPPAGMAFAPLDGAPLNAVVTSESLTLTGFQGALMAEVSGGGTPHLSLDGGQSWTQSALVESGDAVRLRLTTGGQPSTAHHADLHLGPWRLRFTATTGASAESDLPTPP